MCVSEQAEEQDSGQRDQQSEACSGGRTLFLSYSQLEADDVPQFGLIVLFLGPSGARRTTELLAESVRVSDLELCTDAGGLLLLVEVEKRLGDAVVKSQVAEVLHRLDIQ